MRAAVVNELGRAPRPGELADPTLGDADVLVEIEAAPLNPIDLAIVAGRNPAGHPPLPFLPGCRGLVRRGAENSRGPRTLSW
jgi:NADPH:quinone reductase-like Zn-dependent oxidoreductase